MSIYSILEQEACNWPSQNYPSFLQLQLEGPIHFVIQHFLQWPCCLVLFHSCRCVGPSCARGPSPCIVATPVKTWVVSVLWSWLPSHAAVLTLHVSWGNIYLDLKSKSDHTKIVTEEEDYFFWDSYAQIFFCKVISLLDCHDIEQWKSEEHLIIQPCGPHTHRGNYHLMLYITFNT